MDIRIAYGILGVEPGSPLRAVKRRYRKLARALHPDLHPEIGSEPFQRLGEAYQEICAALEEGRTPAARKYQRAPGRRSVPLSELFQRLGYQVSILAKTLQPAAAQVAAIKHLQDVRVHGTVQPLLYEVWLFVDRPYFPYELRDRYVNWTKRRMVNPLQRLWDDIGDLIDEQRALEEVGNQLVREVVERIPFVRIVRIKDVFWAEFDPVVGEIDPYIDGPVRAEWGWDRCSPWVCDRLLTHLESTNSRAISAYRSTLIKGLNDWMQGTETFKDFLRAIGQSTRTIPVHAIAPREAYNDQAPFPGVAAL